MFFIKVQLLFLVITLLLNYDEGYVFQCPHHAQWSLRAKEICNATEKYYCLFDDNNKQYKEFCRGSYDFEKSGYKLIVVGDLQREICHSNRYQPIQFWSNGSSDCILSKSTCNEEGQLTFHNGTNVGDRACRCDYTRGYDFVNTQTNRCFVIPLDEDCSCYLKHCDAEQILTPGFGHIAHEDFCQQHTTTVAKTLFTNESSQAVIILDGTYVYIQKSSNYRFQRQSYSLHKHRSLVKPMVIVASDGYILSVLGPYLADYHNNDAAITKHLFKHNLEKINDWMEENDVCIVDRGFRDAVEFLEDHGYNVKMPFYLNKNSKQHTTEEANKSRLVTKVRWVVESTNGRIKQFRMLDKVVPNTLSKYIGDFVRIACALLNRFRGPVTTLDEKTEKIANEMMHKAKMDNELKVFLEDNGLITKRSDYKSLESADIMDFPQLTLDDLRTITMGIYQLKQAPCYTKDHLNEDGQYELLVFKETEGLIKVKIQSRHSKNTTYTLWIQYIPSSDKPIAGWYCTCKVGSRIVGCCAHIASVLWFWGFERYQGNRLSKDTNDTFLNAADIPSDTESDTSEDEDSSDEFTEE